MANAPEEVITISEKHLG